MLESVDISVSEGVVSPLIEGDIESIIDFVLKAESVDRPCFVSVSLVSDEEMHELNLEWRDVDAPTDVLSLECERPDDPGLSEGEPCELGDIVLAPAYITEQAKRLGTTSEKEMTLLLVHGVLHLLGYDHIEEDEALAMEEREDEIVSLLTGEATKATLTRHRDGDDA